MRWPFVDFKKQDVQVKTWDFIKKDCFFFLVPILSACIITSSLIHEVTTLMKQLFKFWDRHLSVQIAYLIKKGFLKHVMQAMVHGYERKEFHKLKRCLRFQELRININYSSIFFPLVVFIEKVTYNLVNLKDQNSLNIGHNANPAFSLMNNQSNLFEDTIGFILDTPKDMKLDFFGVDFWHLLCLSSIETYFAPLRIDRHCPSFPPFFFLLLHSLPQSFFGWPSIYDFSSSSPFSIIRLLF